MSLSGHNIFINQRACFCLTTFHLTHCWLIDTELTAGSAIMRPEQARARRRVLSEAQPGPLALGNTRLHFSTCTWGSFLNSKSTNKKHKMQKEKNRKKENSGTKEPQSRTLIYSGSTDITRRSVTLSDLGRGRAPADSLPPPVHVWEWLRKGHECRFGAANQL